MEHRIIVSLGETQAALDGLVAAGLVFRRTRADGTARYRVNLRRRSQIERLCASDAFQSDSGRTTSRRSVARLSGMKRKLVLPDPLRRQPRTTVAANSEQGDGHTLNTK